MLTQCAHTKTHRDKPRTHAHTHTNTHESAHLVPGHAFVHQLGPTCAHTHTHARICLSAPTWRLDMDLLTCAHLHTHTCTHLRTCAHLAPGHACAHLCPPPRTHMCTHMHTFPHLHPPAHAHMHIFAHLRPPRAWTCTICLPVPTCAGLRPGWIAAQHPQLGVANKFF
jgi:hypothetical protein